MELTTIEQLRDKAIASHVCWMIDNGLKPNKDVIHSIRSCYNVELLKSFITLNGVEN